MTEESTILDVLNSDCWSHIFSYVSTKNLIRSERVSKQWRGVVTEYFRRNSRRTFKTSWCSKMKLKTLIELLRKKGAAFTRLYIQDTSYLKLDRFGWLHYNSNVCPNLEDLIIDAYDTNGYLKPFFNCKNLKSITLLSYDCRFAEKLFTQLFLNVDFSLERLALTSDLTTGQFLTDNIIKFQNMKYLSFYKCSNIKKENLINIKQLSNLTTLRVNHCSFRVLENVLEILGCLTHLQALILNNYNSSTIHGDADHIKIQTEGQFCEALSKLTLLKHLHLSSNKFVTYYLMNQVAKSCKYLESLDISNSCVGNEGVIAVCRSCKNLQELNVSDLRKLSNHGLSAVPHLVRLVRLTARGLRSSNITASFAACLQSCSALSELDVKCSNVTSELVEAAVAALEENPRPLVLRLTNTRVTVIEELPRHRYLTVLF